MNELYQFTKQDLELISQIQKHQTVTKIFYHFWINLANPEEKFVFVDTIEMIFDDVSTYFFKITEEDNGYTISTDNNFEEEKKVLQQRFQDVISMQRADVSEATIWKNKINKQISSVNIAVEPTNRNENFVYFDFQEGALGIFYNEEKGLLVEDYEA